MLLALDFDGVISDSAPESFWVAWCTFRELLEEPAPAPTDPLPTRDELLSHPLFRPFVELMPLGNRAEDYAVVLGILREGSAVGDQADYDRARAAWPEARLAAFHRRFYARRHALAAAQPDAWHALMDVYPGLPAALRTLSEDWQLGIATAKDRASVVALLARYGLADLFPEALLLDKEAGRSKTAHLEALQQRSGIPFREILFVDDKVNHLDAVAPLGVGCALACWGYNDVREAELARSHGHRLLERDTLAQRVEAWRRDSRTGLGFGEQAS